MSRIEIAESEQLEVSQQMLDLSEATMVQSGVESIQRRSRQFGHYKRVNYSQMLSEPC